MTGERGPDGLIVSDAVIPAVWGDRLTLPDRGQNHVEVRCTGESIGYACLGCRQRLANWGQVEMHIDDGSRHVIARLCGAHGWEAL